MMNIDANLAGQIDSCTLYIYDMDTNISTIPDQDHTGIMFVNPDELDLTDLILMWYIRRDVDYRISENFNTLRYSKVIIHSKASNDIQSHIYENYPTLTRYIFDPHD